LVLSLGDQQSERSVITQPITNPDDGPIGDQPGRAPLNDRSVISRAPIGDHPDRSPALKTFDQSPVGAEVDRARDDDDGEPWRRGPGRVIQPTKVYQPGHGPGRDNRPTPTPPSWQSPRTNPDPEIAKRGAALARELLGKRPAKPDAKPKRDDGGMVPPTATEDERRATARRFVERTRAERERAAMPQPKPDDDEGPPDEIPF